MALSADEENKSLSYRIQGHIFYYNVFLDELVGILKAYDEAKMNRGYLDCLVTWLKQIQGCLQTALRWHM
jgi:hypothetical protein